MNFHILFAYFPYAFQMIFPTLALSSSLTGAFPLLGRHVADMKSVTNVFMCVCVCAGGKQAQLNVWMARQLAVFSKKKERVKKEEGEGFRLVPHVKCKCNFQFRRVCENQQMKGKTLSILIFALLSPLLYLLYIHSMWFSTARGNWGWGWLVKDGPQRSPRHTPPKCCEIEMTTKAALNNSRCSRACYTNIHTFSISALYHVHAYAHLTCTIWMDLGIRTTRVHTRRGRKPLKRPTIKTKSAIYSQGLCAYVYVCMHT